MNPAGRRNRRVTIQARATTKGTYGEQADTWTDVGTWWTEIRGLSGRELTAAQQINTEVTHRLCLPYDALLANPVEMAKRRAAYGTRIFNIKAAVIVEERNREIVLFCTEGMSNG